MQAEKNAGVRKFFAVIFLSALFSVASCGRKKKKPLESPNPPPAGTSKKQEPEKQKSSAPASKMHLSAANASKNPVDLSSPSAHAGDSTSSHVLPGTGQKVSQPRERKRPQAGGNEARDNRTLNRRLPASSEKTPPLVIADFENGSNKPFEKGEVIDIPGGKGKGLKMPAKKYNVSWPYLGLPADWSSYDVLAFDAYNLGDAPVKLSVQIRDKMERGYWSWHDRYLGLAPGRNEMTIPVADLWRGEILRRDIGGTLDPKNITRLVFNCEGDWILDNFRLQKNSDTVTIPGLKAFDVGKTGTPVFPGFTPLTEKDRYSKEKGYGWLNADFARMDDRIHPDDLFRDNLSCRNCELAVDLPNGKYVVQMQLEDPGYWEFMQNYENRKVFAEDKKVIDESMDASEFLGRYFRNQDTEDFPDEDPFVKYVETRQPWHVFETDVTDGQLNLAFRSWSSYGNTLSALIIYPAKEAGDAEKYMERLTRERRKNWAQRWKPVSKSPAEPEFKGKAADEADRYGFVLFRVQPEENLSFDFVPGDDRLVTETGCAAARNEFEPITFGLKPAEKLGKVTVTVSDLAGPGGAVITADSLDPRVNRYMFKRYKGHQSGMYSVESRQLRLFNTTPENELKCDHGMLRVFWLTVRPQKDAPPGEYSGTVTVKAAKGGERSLKIRVTLLPFELPEPDYLFTLYGITLLPKPYYPEMRENRPARVRKMMADLREHGINYITNLPVKVEWKDNKAEITNQGDVDKFLAMCRELGFHRGPVDAPGGAGRNELSGTGTIRGLPVKEFIKNWHLELTDKFKEYGWPHPSFCFGDEPNVPEVLVALTKTHQALHAVSPDIWTRIAYNIALEKESVEMLKTLDVHHLKGFVDPKYFAMARKYGAKYVFSCNVPSNRLEWGLGQWVMKRERKTDGVISFSYTGSHVDIYYGLDAREDDYIMAPPRRDGSFAKTQRFELIREAVDDFRYAQLLGETAGKPGVPATIKREAEGLLDEAGGLGKKKGSQENYAACRAWRTKVQELLEKAAR